MMGIHHFPYQALLTRSLFPPFETVWTHCLARTSGALQPGTSQAMRVRARRKKNTQPASIAFVFQASRVSTRIAPSLSHHHWHHL